MRVLMSMDQRGAPIILGAKKQRPWEEELRVNQILSADGRLTWC
jgi:hypothetical protein